MKGAYEACLACELRKDRLKVLSQVPLPLAYKEVKLDLRCRPDLLVEDLAIVEVKSVDLARQSPMLSSCPI